MSDFFLRVFGLKKTTRLEQLRKNETEMRDKLEDLDWKIQTQYVISGRAVLEKDLPSARKAWGKNVKLKSTRKKVVSNLKIIQTKREQMESTSATASRITSRPMTASFSGGGTATFQGHPVTVVSRFEERPMVVALVGATSSQQSVGSVSPELVDHSNCVQPDPMTQLQEHEILSIQIPTPTPTTDEEVIYQDEVEEITDLDNYEEVQDLNVKISSSSSSSSSSETLSTDEANRNFSSSSSSSSKVKKEIAIE